MSLSTVIRQSFEDTKTLKQRQDHHMEKWVWDHLSYTWFGIHNFLEEGSREMREMKLVAAFHDIGKIPTTDRKSEDSGGYIVSYGHAEKSVEYWDAVSDAFCEGTDLRADVIRWLIKEHMNIKFKDRMNENTLHTKKQEAANLGDRVWILGNLLRLADDMLDFFDRHNMDYIEPEHPSDEVEVIDRHEEAIGRFEDYVDWIVETISDWEEPYDNKELVLLRGVSGSGKSTVAEMMAGPHGEIFEADEFFEGENGYDFDSSKLPDAHSWCESQVEEAMEGGTPRIIVSNTSTQVWEFLPYLRLAAKNGYRVHSLVKEKRHDGTSNHGVPQSSINKQRDRFEIQL